MADELVSVCIPAYNSANTIEKTLDSIIAQTYRPLEIIVVDDCSRDDTVDIVKVYMQNVQVKVAESEGEARQLSFLIYENSHNLGMSGNWNECLKKCNGQYVKLICADDTLDPTCIEKEVTALRVHPDAMMASSDTGFVDKDGKPCGAYNRYFKSGLVDGKKIAKTGFFIKDFFGAPLANTFRREQAIEMGGFDDRFSYIIDYDFFMNLAIKGKVYIIREKLNFFMVRSDSNTGNVFGNDKEKTAIYVDEHKRLLEKYRNELGLNSFMVGLSVLIRRLHCMASSVYMKIVVR